MPITGYVSHCLGLTSIYTGPGDVTSGASGWWGLRAYSQAKIGTSAVRLRRDSDQAESDIASIVGGGLDMAAITSFKGAANLFVVTLYDQAGANNLTNATAATQPAFTLNAIGILPGMTTDAVSSQTLASAGNLATSAPTTISYIAKRTGNTGATNSVVRIFQSATAQPNAGFPGSINEVFVFCGNIPNAVAADNAFHAVQNRLNADAADVIMVDGVDTTGLDAGASFNTGAVEFSAGVTVAQPLTGVTLEMGIWPLAFTAGQRTSMNSNQHSYWSF